MGIFCDSLYSVFLFNAILGLDFLGLALLRPQVAVAVLSLGDVGYWCAEFIMLRSFRLVNHIAIAALNAHGAAGPHTWIFLLDTLVSCSGLAIQWAILLEFW